MKQSILKRIRVNLAYEEARRARDAAYTINGWAASQFLEDQFLQNQKNYKVLLPSLKISRRNLKEVKS